ncbi:MAG: 3'(2'),5'-bisphosphate nucleotidase CysQ [Rikenellaceae bacterium]
MIGRLKLALEAAIAASRDIMMIYNDPNSDFGIERKADNSPLTRADVAAHRVISSMLVASGVPILSEEGRSIPFAERSEWERLWVVDPIDGTKEFIKRNGEFTVNIALVEAGVPTLGVIYAPALKELYFGCSQLGAFKLSIDDETMGVEQIMELATPLSIDNNPERCTVVASRSHLNAETESFIERLRGEVGDVECVSRGSSLKICLIAEGSATVYPRYAPTMEWDTAAGDAILRSLGGGAALVEAGSGEPLRYNKEDLLNPHFITRK